jgi:hypothetical protein
MEITMIVFMEIIGILMIIFGFWGYKNSKAFGELGVRGAIAKHAFKFSESAMEKYGKFKAVLIIGAGIFFVALPIFY